MESLDERSLDWDGHLLLFHRTELERRSGVAAWVRHGLGQGARVVYLERADTPTAKTLRGILDQHPVDGAAEALETGQLLVREPTRTLVSSAGLADLVARANHEGFRSLRLSGDSTASYSDGTPEAETLVADLCLRGELSVLCQYPTGLLPSRRRKVLEWHSDGVRTCAAYLRTRGDVVVLAGELDAASADALSLALEAISSRGEPGLRVVDMAGLDFLDVAGCHAVLTGTADLRARGGRVLLRDPRPPVRRVLELVGVEKRQGVVIRTAAP